MYMYTHKLTYIHKYIHTHIHTQVSTSPNACTAEKPSKTTLAATGHPQRACFATYERISARKYFHLPQTWKSTVSKDASRVQSVNSNGI